MNRFYFTGSPRKNDPGTRPLLIPEENLIELKYHLIENPSLYLKEIQEYLEEKQINASIPTIFRALKRINFTRKTLKRFSPRIDEISVLNYLAMVEDLPASMFLFLDETGKKETDCQRRFGYGLRGKPVKSPSFKRGEKRVNAIAVISIDGLEDFHLTTETFKAEDVRDFVRDFVLPKTSPFPGPKSILVLDKYY
jgi:hypothetical protein